MLLQPQPIPARLELCLYLSYIYLWAKLSLICQNSVYFFAYFFLTISSIIINKPHVIFNCLRAL
nr:MAG TPA: hypothetical protein [Caudoviricetes sp.]